MQSDACQYGEGRVHPILNAVQDCIHDKFDFIYLVQVMLVHRLSEYVLELLYRVLALGTHSKLGLSFQFARDAPGNAFEKVSIKG